MYANRACMLTLKAIRCNGVGCSPLLAQDTHARKRLFLDWQSADDTATLHAFYTTTPGIVQQPEGVFENKKRSRRL
jgi:hypothetical protein